MEFADRVLTCIDCGQEFVFTAGEQVFFHEKQFQHDPKRCKKCKFKRQSAGFVVRNETKTVCAECGAETTVPFRPRLSKPVLCRACFDKKKNASSQPPPSGGAAPFPEANGGVSEK